MYRAPVTDILHTLLKVTGTKAKGLEQVLQEERFGDLSQDLLSAILDEAARFTENRIVPLRQSGDQEGATLQEAHVTTAKGWKELYQDWAAAGWNSLTGATDYDGQGLPVSLSVAVNEMWNAGSLGFAIGPILTIGAVEALEQHASQAIKDTYLPKLISGEWMGTMNLTEPQAGSDLGALRCRAERRDDGTYRIFGQKIFITYGEHDLTDNIIHLVLARLPDAPEGSRGISLFLVPKFLSKQDGSLGQRNDVFCAGLEHKLGIHASPTCTMIFGDSKGIFGDGTGELNEAGAVGYLIGEENRGLACMFTMMNNARLLVGIQGVGVAEAATQKAIAYAKERMQGRNSGKPSSTQAEAIIVHPDVQRMLLTMKALTQAARSIAYNCAFALDMANMAEPDQQGFWANRASLLTPLAKAFSTDTGVEVASLGVQVHGGMGYIEETGAAQLLRDARITPIYEGTNGIQAIDLVTRKLPLEDGQHIHGFIAELSQEADAAAQAQSPELQQCGTALSNAISDLKQATSYCQECLANKKTDDALAGATAYLRLLSLTAGAAYLVRSALNDSQEARIHLSQFFNAYILPETMALKQSIIGGAHILQAAKTILNA
ncbi:acyl-CoA dehydrogenase [Paenochrobactrum glaciei]|uniref:Acyl-CoA dehydrogenase n=1 Tax=Paenochrobactrum glaciei TaxID=486407 RepID=A0ABP3QNE8_9HYPH